MNQSFNYVSVPVGSPASVAGGFINHTSIYFTWAAIPVQSQNGIIQRYKVAFRQTNSSEVWKTLSVDSKSFRAEMGKLKFNMLYDVKVAGETSVGQGPYSIPISIRTDAIGEESIELLILIKMESIDSGKCS